MHGAFVKDGIEIATLAPKRPHQHWQSVWVQKAPRLGVHDAVRLANAASHF
jgi:hypothetical protein